MATLMDYQDAGVPEAERFFTMHGKLSKNAYAAKITETYGPAAGRDKGLALIVNAAVLLYAIK
jgi:hypothetical protein